MWNMNDVIKIEYKKDFVYRIGFDEGKSGDVDFTGHLDKGSIFEPLRDKTFFKKANIEGGTIAWPNGSDIAHGISLRKSLFKLSVILPNSILHRQDHFQLVDKGRQIIDDRIPDAIKIDIEIGMDQSISHGHNNHPGDFRVCFTKCRGDSGRRLADYFDRFD